LDNVENHDDPEADADDEGALFRLGDDGVDWNHCMLGESTVCCRKKFRFLGTCLDMDKDVTDGFYVIDVHISSPVDALSEDEVVQIASKLKLLADIKDRSYHLKNYPKCFIGTKYHIYLHRRWKIVAINFTRKIFGRLFPFVKTPRSSFTLIF
jgi:hypothetical protein